MYIIEDRLYFEKTAKTVSLQAYNLNVDDFVIEQRKSNYKTSLLDFKKSVMPNLITLGFDKIVEHQNQIRMIRTRKNLNESLDIKEFLHDFRII